MEFFQLEVVLKLPEEWFTRIYVISLRRTSSVVVENHARWENEYCYDKWKMEKNKFRIVLLHYTNVEDLRGQAGKGNNNFEADFDLHLHLSVVLDCKELLESWGSFYEY